MNKMLGAALAGVILASAGLAVAQSTPPAQPTIPQSSADLKVLQELKAELAEMGATPQQDIPTMVRARQAMMQAMDNNLIVLERQGDKPDYLSVLVTGSDLSAMLTAQTFMFPPASNPADHPEIESVAKPEVWSDHENFLAQLVAVREMAEKMSNAASVDGMAKLTKDVRAACQACHVAYLKN